jgi:hypothetical protein
MPDQCHDRGPHAWEDRVIANVLLLGGTFTPADYSPGFWCVEWEGGSSAFYGSMYRAGIFYLSQCGFHVTCEGKMEKLG